MTLDDFIFVLPLLIAGVISGTLTIGLQHDAARKARINQGITLSIRNTVYVGLLLPLMVLFVPTVIAFAMLGTTWLEWGLLPWPVGWFLLAVCIGGFDAIQHYWLRLQLSVTRQLPLRTGEVLVQADRLILMRRVGGGFIFVHRLLLEHLAQRRSGAARLSLAPSTN